MMSIEAFRALALSFPAAEEKAHFERPSFRVGSKIFATLWLAESRAVVKLDAVDQSAFTNHNPKAFFPVEGSWGKQGYTFIDLRKARKDMISDALSLSWRRIAPRKLQQKIGR